MRWVAARAAGSAPAASLGRTRSRLRCPRDRIAARGAHRAARRAGRRAAERRRRRLNIGKRALVILLVLMTAGGALRAWEAAHPYLERQSPDEVAYARLRRRARRAAALRGPAARLAALAARRAGHVRARLRAAPRPRPPPRLLAPGGRRDADDRRTFLLAWALAGEVAGLAAPPRSWPSTRPSSRPRASSLSEPLGALLLTAATLAVVPRGSTRAYAGRSRSPASSTRSPSSPARTSCSCRPS